MKPYWLDGTPGVLDARVYWHLFVVSVARPLRFDDEELCGADKLLGSLGRHERDSLGVLDTIPDNYFFEYDPVDPWRTANGAETGNLRFEVMGLDRDGECVRNVVAYGTDMTAILAANLDQSRRWGSRVVRLRVRPVSRFWPSGPAPTVEGWMTWTGPDTPPRVRP